MDTANAIHSDFDTRLYDKLAGTHPGKNLLLSPLSIRVALAMCAVGARGETRRVMADLIGAPESVEEQNRQYAWLSSGIPVGSPHFQLVTANALWGQQGYHFKPEFTSAVAEFYGGSFHEVDFRARPDEAVRAINAWVSSTTRDKIRELVNRECIGGDTRLVLANVIYFKGQWETVFEKADTRDEPWHGPKPYKVPMMHQQGNYLYYECDDFQALNLPYKGRQLSMLVVLPRKIDGLTALESRWAAQQTFRTVTAGFDPEAVVVTLPRFKVWSGFGLKPVLCALHADLAFSDDADFSGIGDEPLRISEVVHQAFVEVNEEGTEAAAATAVRTVLSTGLGNRPPEPKIFKADHPFRFFIWARKTNTVFFSGRVLDPLNE